MGGARPGWRGAAGCGNARHGRKGEVGRGLVRRGMAQYGMARQAWQGLARCGVARNGMARQARRGLAGRVQVRYGTAWQASNDIQMTKERGQLAMTLPWVRLDTGLPDHPKMLSLMAGKRHKAALAYVLGLAYCGRHELDGFIPSSALPFIHATKVEATALCEVGLWHSRQGGYEINDWAEYQPSSEETARKKERAREAALKRWNA